MMKFFASFAVFAALASPALGQGFTVLNDRGGSVERSREAGGGELNRSIDRTGPRGREAGRDIKLDRTASGDIRRTTTTTGPRGRQNVRSTTITRN
jgi:hypothetical protein